MSVDFLEHEIQADKLFAFAIHVVVPLLHYLADLYPIFYLD